MKPSDLKDWLADLEKQPSIVQIWIAWGIIWAIMGPFLCVALWLDWMKQNGF